MEQEEEWLGCMGQAPGVSQVNEYSHGLSSFPPDW